MLADLLLGIAAGALAPHAEPRIRQALKGVLLAEAPLSAMEGRLASFAACLAGAALLAHVFGEGEALALALGGLLGVFAPRILDRIQTRRPPDYGPDPDKE